MNQLKSLVTVLICLLACYSVSAGNIKTVHIDPRATDNFKSASFFLRIPDTVKMPRFIYVVLPGHNANGAGIVENASFVGFAGEMNAALVSCTFKSMDRDKIPYVSYNAAQHGSGAALESAIEQFDLENPSHNLKNLPLFISGHSAGGSFAYGFSCYNPKRLIGFVAIKGGYYYPQAIDGSYSVPGLIVSGEMDLPRRRTAIRRLFESYRKQGAPWCWLEDSSGHEPFPVQPVVRAYVKDLVNLRLQALRSPLDVLPKAGGVTIDVVHNTILHEGVPLGDETRNPEIGFLPSRAVFESWAEIDIGERKFAEQDE